MNQKKSDISRTQILDAAAKLFRKHGYATTTLRLIANEANLKAGSIYYYFGSKEEILGEVLDIGIQRIIQAIQDGINQLPANATALDKIRVAIREHLHTLLKYGDYTSANIRIYKQIPSNVRQKHRALRRTYAEEWDQLLNDAQAQGEIRKEVDITLLRLFLLGAMNSAAEWYNPKRGKLEPLFEAVTEFFFDGIKSIPDKRQDDHMLDRELP